MLNGDVNGDGKINIADPVYMLNWLFSHGDDIVPMQRLVATGQGECFALDPHVPIPIDCSDPQARGQDGTYRAGCPAEGRFFDNGDGTVKDQCTGLTWTKTPVDVNPSSSDPVRKVLPWADALRFVEDMTFAGQSDWRVPNALDLASLIDFSDSNTSQGGLHAPFDFQAAVAPIWSSTTTGRMYEGSAIVLSLPFGRLFASLAKNQSGTELRLRRPRPVKRRQSSGDPCAGTSRLVKQLCVQPRPVRPEGNHPCPWIRVPPASAASTISQ